MTRPDDATTEPDEIPRSPASRPAPPVGLNWGVVAEHLGIDRAILEHDGEIVAPGETFPMEGFFLDPASLTARHVDVGDFALKAGYFLGDLSVSEFGIELPLNPEPIPTEHPVIPQCSGPVIALFTDEAAARRASERIVHNSLGTGAAVERSSLGFEVRILKPEVVGRVATVLAGEGGAVLSMGGISVGLGEAQGPASTGSSSRGGVGDARRAGMGATSDSEGPEIQNAGTEAEGGEEVRPA